MHGFRNACRRLLHLHIRVTTSAHLLPSMLAHQLHSDAIFEQRAARPYGMHGNWLVQFSPLCSSAKEVTCDARVQISRPPHIPVLIFKLEDIDVAFAFFHFFNWIDFRPQHESQNEQSWSLCMSPSIVVRHVWQRLQSMLFANRGEAFFPMEATAQAESLPPLHRFFLCSLNFHVLWRKFKL